MIDSVRDLPTRQHPLDHELECSGGGNNGIFPHREYRNEVPCLIVSLERSPLRRLCRTNEVAAARAAGEPCADGVNCAEDSESDRQQEEE